MEKIGEKMEAEGYITSADGQIIAGTLKKYHDERKIEPGMLPRGVAENQIIIFHKGHQGPVPSKGLVGWQWRLKSEFVTDPKKKEQFETEEKLWNWK